MSLCKLLGFFGEATPEDLQNKHTSINGKCDVFEVTCKLVGLLRMTTVSKVNLNILKQVKTSVGVEALDCRLQARIKDALALR